MMCVVDRKMKTSSSQRKKSLGKVKETASARSLRRSDTFAHVHIVKHSIFVYKKNAMMYRGI